MSENICRLCLSDNNLNPLFKNQDDCDQYSVVLELTTGLKIKHNDDLPQLICTLCTELVNSALKLRNQSRLSETKLLNYEQSKKENGNKNITEKEKDESIIEESDIINESIKNNQFIDFRIDVQFDRLIENDDNATVVEEAQGQSVIQPSIDKMSRKEKRDMYMSMVEGGYDPRRPVKCRICKKSVSKWSCFVSHVKLHIGFKFVCEYCGKSFISSTQLKRHCRSHHGMRRELQCKNCGYLALDNAQLLVHERREHTGERPYICDVCNSSYYSRKCLLQHIEGHRTDATVKCETCGQMLKSRRHLARHRYSAHNTPPGGGRLRCPVCTRLYSRKYLRAHMAQHDKRPTETPDHSRRFVDS